MFVRRKWIWKVKSERSNAKSNAKIIYKLFFFKVHWWWFCLELKLFICTHSRSSKAQMLPLNCHKLLTVSNHSPLIWCEAHCKHNQKLKIFNNSFDITNTIWLGLWIPFNQNDNSKKCVKTVGSVSVLSFCHSEGDVTKVAQNDTPLKSYGGQSDF